MITLPAFEQFEKVRQQKPIIHHLTNWVTIYDCAQIVKTMGASPIMAHAPAEMAEMARIASAVVLNIGTLTPELVESMKIAARTANNKGIPVVLDVCGAGATRLRDEKCFELLDETRISIIKGNASEIARIAGESIQSRGVDSAEVTANKTDLVRKLAKTYKAVAVMTGPEDIISNGEVTYVVSNGHPIMTSVVGTGCMAASVIGTFAAIEKDYALASACGLVCYEIAAEQAASECHGPASFKEKLFDSLYSLNNEVIAVNQKVRVV